MPAELTNPFSRIVGINWGPPIRYATCRFYWTISEVFGARDPGTCGPPAGYPSSPGRFWSLTGFEYQFDLVSEKNLIAATPATAADLVPSVFRVVRDGAAYILQYEGDGTATLPDMPANLRVEQGATPQFSPGSTPYFAPSGVSLFDSKFPTLSLVDWSAAGNIPVYADYQHLHPTPACAGSPFDATGEKFLFENFIETGINTFEVVNFAGAKVGYVDEALNIDKTFSAVGFKLVSNYDPGAGHAGVFDVIYRVD